MAVNPVWFTVGAGIFQEEENRETRSDSARITQAVCEVRRYARFLGVIGNEKI